MGSAVNANVVRELEREAYASVLRAVHIKNPSDYLTLEDFLLKTRTQLNITNEEASEILGSVRTDIELIRRGQRPAGLTATNFTSPGTLPPGSKKRAEGSKKRKDPPPPLMEPSDEEEWAIAERRKAQRTKAGGKKQAAAQQQQQRPIGAPGGSRPRNRPSGGGGGARPAAGGGGGGGGGGVRHPTLVRNRSTRSMGSVDPINLVGRRIWRYYPNEDPERPWVEGFVVEYDPDTNTYGILYDPNVPMHESKEEGFDLETANPAEYVLGDYFDLESCVGSQRQASRPTPVTLAPAAAVAAPAKRRRSAAMRIPPGVPFPATWLESALAEATTDDLHTMLNMLSMREEQLAAGIQDMDMAMLLGPDLEKRATLEREFEELCKKEEKVMAELKAVTEQ